MSTVAEETTITTEETQEVRVATGGFSVSCSRGTSSATIVLESSTLTQDELDKLVHRAQVASNRYAALDLVRAISTIAGDEVHPWTETVEAVDDHIEMSISGATLTFDASIVFDGPVPDSPDLRTAVKNLGSVVLDVLVNQLNMLAIDSAHGVQPEVAEYLDALAGDQATPIEELVPPGLESGYWIEFVERFQGTCCGRPDCAGGVLKALGCYNEEQLIECGISEEAAAAISSNPAVQFITYLEGEMTDMIASSLADSPVVGLSLDDLADVFGGLGEPRPSGSGRNGNGAGRRRMRDWLRI